ncbi:hypothetical protein ACQPZP_09395 [Spirillospora sp. CA-142024]|uniref:hypothetical protein n=1 Tax=Spirillospora sp. CA-142024 TaxID=3240036 RepID=UPI003D9357F0
MSPAYRGYIAEPWGQPAPRVLQRLTPFTLAAGESLVGRHREVGEPGRALSVTSQEACRRFGTMVDALRLRGITGKDETLVDTTAGGPDGLASAGFADGGDVDHWWIGGDLDHAFETAPDVITLLVGAGGLRSRRRAVARTPESAVPLEWPASESDLSELDGDITSIGFGPRGHILGVEDLLWCLKSAVTRLVRALPADGPTVRLRFRVPVEERWLPLLTALRLGRVQPEVCTTWFERTRRDRRLLTSWFTGQLAGMLGEHRHRVQVVFHDALREVGEELEAAVIRGEKPGPADLIVKMRAKDDEVWKLALHPRVQAAVSDELHTEGLFAPGQPPELGGLKGLVDAADVVDMMRFGLDGLAIVIDEPSAAWRMVTMTERFARHYVGEATRSMAIGAPTRVWGRIPDPSGPFARFRGDPGHMVVLNPDDPSVGKRVRSNVLFNELYSVR